MGIFGDGGDLISGIVDGPVNDVVSDGGIVNNVVNGNGIVGEAVSEVLTDSVKVASSAQVQAILKMVTALQLATIDWPPNASVNDGDTFDYIVVGCGVGGSVIASRLTEMSKISVLAIEAGGDPPLNSRLPLTLPFLVETEQDWKYYTEDDNFSCRSTKGNKVEWTSGKMLGGSSSLDHMFHIRGSAADFIPWAEAAEDDSWGWDGLYEYFLKGEKLIDKDILNSEFKNRHGTDGYVKVEREPDKIVEPYLEACKEIGHQVVLDLFSNSSIGCGQNLYTIADGMRQSHAYTYLRSIKYRSNLHVLKNSEVAKIIFEDNEAVGVKVISDSKTITLNARKEIIVTAGVLNTPKLLMLSGIGPKEHLENLGIKVISDLPVGKNLQDHMSVTVLHKTKTSLAPKLGSLPSPFKFPAAVFFDIVALKQYYPDYLTINGVFGPESPAVIYFFCSVVFRYEDEICQRMIKSNIGREILYSTVSALHPKSRGEILLRSSDPSDPPLIKAGYMSDRRDLEDMVDYIEDYLRLEDTEVFQSVHAEMVDLKLPQCENLEYKSREYWRCYVRCMSSTTFHYSSSCPIGTVLDNKLRVRGVERLRVADASAMPTIVSGNNKLATQALAEKGAVLIKDDI